MITGRLSVPTHGCETHASGPRDSRVSSQRVRNDRAEPRPPTRPSTTNH